MVAQILRHAGMNILFRLFRAIALAYGLIALWTAFFWQVVPIFAYFPVLMGKPFILSAAPSSLSAPEQSEGL
jgi:hypothetical protein